MCKGADNVIKSILNEESLNGEILSKTQEFCNEFSRSGLRTLFLARKEVT